MRTVRVYQYGGPKELRLEQIPRPEPQAGEVLLRVIAAGVLPADVKRRQGFFRGIHATTFPYIPGSAVAGVVEAVGPDVTAFAPGDAVFGRTNNGAYAEYTTAAVETLALKPETLSFAEAATISGGATTAWTSLFDNGQLQAGQRALIHGGAGGVGLYAVQLARWKGAQVIATASGSNVEFVRSLGADIVIDYTKTPFEEATGAVDLVLDTVGGEVTERSLRVIRRGGTLVSLLEEPPEEVARARGVRAIKNSVTFPYPPTALLNSIAGLIVEGHIRAVVGPCFPLQEVQQAHALCETGHGRGRIVLMVAEAGMQRTG